MTSVSNTAAVDQLRAMRRTLAFETWAIDNDQPEFLRNFVTASKVDGDLVALLRQVRDQHGIVQMDNPLEISQAFLFPATSSDTLFLQRQGYDASATAMWRASFKNPVTVSATIGSKTTTLVLVPSTSVDVAVGGTAKAAGILGTIFEEGFLLPCGLDGAALSVCLS